MAANTPANTGLLLDDDDDAPVPIVTPARAAMPQPLSEPASDAAVADSWLVHPGDAPSELIERALAWVTDPLPTIGLRALVLAVSGLNMGVSRRERELRLLYCALYRAAYDQPEPER